MGDTIPQNTPQSKQPPQKQCTKCHIWLPFSAFTKATKSRDGLQWRCNDCKLAYQNTYRSTLYKKHLLRYSYGLTIQQYERMLDAQGGVCAVCKQPETHIDTHSPVGAVRDLCVDHDHKTGDVRALLCSSCNVALGRLKEDPERIRALADYAEWCQNREPKSKIVQLKLID